MTNSERMILSDAIEQAIENELKYIKWRRIAICLCVIVIVLSAILIGG